jgi:hypothetical protein
MQVIDQPKILFANPIGLSHPLGFSRLVPLKATGVVGLMEEAASICRRMGTDGEAKEPDRFPPAHCLDLPRSPRMGVVGSNDLDRPRSVDPDPRDL